MALDLKMTREKTGLFFLTVTQDDGITPWDLSGDDLWFHAAYALFGFVIDKSTTIGGVTITNATLGLATLEIDPADSAALPTTGTYQMPCELTLVVGPRRFELNSGRLTIEANVGEP